MNYEQILLDFRRCLSGGLPSGLQGNLRKAVHGVEVKLKPMNLDSLMVKEDGVLQD